VEDLERKVASIEDLESGERGMLLEELLKLPTASYTVLMQALGGVRTKLTDGEFHNKTYILELFARLSLKLSTRDFKRYPEVLKAYKLFFKHWLADAQADKPFRFHVRMKVSKKSWIGIIACQCLQDCTLSMLVPDALLVLSYAKQVHMVFRLLRSLQEDGKHEDERLFSLVLRAMECLLSARPVRCPEVEDDIEGYLRDVLLAAKYDTCIPFARAALSALLREHTQKMGSFTAVALQYAVPAGGGPPPSAEVARHYFLSLALILREDPTITVKKGCPVGRILLAAFYNMLDRDVELTDAAVDIVYNLWRHCEERAAPEERAAALAAFGLTRDEVFSRTAIQKLSTVLAAGYAGEAQGVLDAYHDFIAGRGDVTSALALQPLLYPWISAAVHQHGLRPELLRVLMDTSAFNLSHDVSGGRLEDLWRCAVGTVSRARASECVRFVASVYDKAQSPRAEADCHAVVRCLCLLSPECARAVMGALVDGAVLWLPVDATLDALETFQKIVTVVPRERDGPLEAAHLALVAHLLPSMDPTSLEHVIPDILLLAPVLRNTDGFAKTDGRRLLAGLLYALRHSSDPADDQLRPVQDFLHAKFPDFDPYSPDSVIGLPADVDPETLFLDIMAVVAPCWTDGGTLRRTTIEKALLWGIHGDDENIRISALQTCGNLLTPETVRREDLERIAWLLFAEWGGKSRQIVIDVAAQTIAKAAVMVEDRADEALFVLSTSILLMVTPFQETFFAGCHMFATCFSSPIVKHISVTKWEAIEKMWRTTFNFRIDVSGGLDKVICDALIRGLEAPEASSMAVGIFQQLSKAFEKIPCKWSAKLRRTGGDAAAAEGEGEPTFSRMLLVTIVLYALECMGDIGGSGFINALNFLFHCGQHEALESMANVFVIHSVARPDVTSILRAKPALVAKYGGTDPDFQAQESRFSQFVRIPELQYLESALDKEDPTDATPTEDTSDVQISREDQRVSLFADEFCEVLVESLFQSDLSFVLHVLITLSFALDDEERTSCLSLLAHLLRRYPFYLTTIQFRRLERLLFTTSLSDDYVLDITDAILNYMGERAPLECLTSTQTFDFLSSQTQQENTFSNRVFFRGFTVSPSRNDRPAFVNSFFSEQQRHCEMLRGALGDETAQSHLAAYEAEAKEKVAAEEGYCKEVADRQANLATTLHAEVKEEARALVEQEQKLRETMEKNFLDPMIFAKGFDISEANEDDSEVKSKKKSKRDDLKKSEKKKQKIVSVSVSSIEKKSSKVTKRVAKAAK